MLNPPKIITLTALSLLLGACNSSSGNPPPTVGGTPDTSVLQNHGDAARDGVFIDSRISKSSIPKYALDTAFHGQIQGSAYAQPLYWTNSQGHPLLIIATEQNQVSALDPYTGITLWSRNLGAPVPQSSLLCGDIDPLGITGTPVIDPGSGTVYLDSMQSAQAGVTGDHMLFALSLEDGSTRAGWPLHVSALLQAQGLQFNSTDQNQRGALTLLNGTLYVPYGGHFGDCGSYHGWVVGVPINQPAPISAWETRDAQGGVWAPGGVVVDGSSLLIATGNTASSGNVWQDGEAVIRLTPGLSFSRQPQDYFAPTNWLALSDADLDLGGTSPLVFQGSGAGFVMVLGKDGNAYVVNHSSLGGVTSATITQNVSSVPIIGIPAFYDNGSGTTIVFRGQGVNCPSGQSGDLVALNFISNPPSLSTLWCAVENGRGSPIISTTDGRNDAVVWVAGAEGDNHLRAFDAQSGTGLLDVPIPGTIRRFSVPISGNAEIYVAGDNQVFAFH